MFGEMQKIAAKLNMLKNIFQQVLLIFPSTFLQLFGKVARNMGEIDTSRAGSDVWEQINNENHFRSFFPAVQVLFR